MAIIDWIIIAFFLVALTGIGFYFSKKSKNLEDYFLGGRSMPMWLVAFAAVGTSISAGTFVGSPQIAFDGNYTYIMMSVGAIFGGILAALVILPTLYKANSITIYGYIGNRFGNGSKTATSIMFLIGQLLTSGSRLFIAAIAVSVMLYGQISFSFLVISIILLGVISTIYTMAGGIKGLIYIDTFQILLVIGTGILSIILIYNAIPESFGEIIGTLRHAPEGNKLKLIDPSFSFAEPYNLMGALIACAIFKFAQFSTDHEFVQRQLTCRSVKKASVSLIWSQLISLPVVVIFMIIGSLLYIAYPHIMPQETVATIAQDSRDVFPQYICSSNVPAGIRGLMIVGLLAAALSSFNSAINSMTSSFVDDIYNPLRERFNRPEQTNKQKVRTSRIMVLGMGAVLTAFAIVACLMQEAGGQNLVDFALGIMSFSYAGMLGVFLCAVWTKRGNTVSVISALVVGALVVLALQPNILAGWSEPLFGTALNIAWPWWCPIGAVISFGVCCLGKKKQLPATCNE